MKTMDIYSKRGVKVKATYPQNGTKKNKKDFAKHLDEDSVYTVSRISVGDWFSRVYLKEVPNISFNSVHFTNTNGKD